MRQDVSTMPVHDCLKLLEALEPGSMAVWRQYVEKYALSDQQALEHVRLAVLAALAAASGARKSS